MSVDDFSPKIIGVEDYTTDVSIDGGLSTDVTGTRITVLLSGSSPPSAEAIADSLDDHFGDTQWRSSSRYEHIEPLPETKWTINHSLDRTIGFVEVLNDTGSPVLYERLTQVTSNVMEIEFTAPQSGKAYLT